MGAGARLPSRQAAVGASAPAPRPAQGEAKERLLRLLSEGGKSAPELGRALGISAVAVRRHLAQLLETGLLEVQEEKPRGRGRPQQVYRLSLSGREHLAGDYAGLCHALLTAARSCFGAAGVEQLLAEVGNQMRAQWQSQLSPLPPAQRLHALAQLLCAAGYQAEVSEQGQDLLLIQHNCPHLALARCHPEMCTTEWSTYQAFFPEARVRPCGQVASGACSCRYRLELES